MSSDVSLNEGFTLIELLVVIAIIAILSVVVILTLNPAELLRQSRDSLRLSDMATVNSAMGVYTTDQSSASSFNMGSSSVLYLSTPDSSATSTVGDQCQGFTLSALPSFENYHCTNTLNSRNTNATGWIPINFSLISSGAPIGALPVDPTNNYSNRLFYSYTTNALAQYEVTAAMESQKYKLGGSSDAISSDGGILISAYEKGTASGLAPLDYGDNSLVGYWPLTEATGSVAYDWSGNNATGSWSGTPSGSNGYYIAGKVGGWAGYFNGTNNYINVPNGAQPLTTFTLSAWVYPTALAQGGIVDSFNLGGTLHYGYALSWDQNSLGAKFSFLSGNGATFEWTNTSGTFPLNQWEFVVAIYSGTTKYIYVNGALASVPDVQSFTSRTGNLLIGNDYADTPTYGRFPGYIDDVRIYNRALSSGEVQAIYNAGK